MFGRRFRSCGRPIGTLGLIDCGTSSTSHGCRCFGRSIDIGSGSLVVFYFQRWCFKAFRFQESFSERHIKAQASLQECAIPRWLECGSRSPSVAGSLFLCTREGGFCFYQSQWRRSARSVFLGRCARNHRMPNRDVEDVADCLRKIAHLWSWFGWISKIHRGD